MSERGYFAEKYAASDGDDESEAPAESLKATIASIKEQCAHVYSEPENGDMLDELIAAAQEFYSADEAGWERLLNQTKRKLDDVEDPTEVEDILRAAITEGTELMN